MAEQTPQEVNTTPTNDREAEERGEVGEPAQEWGGRNETGKAIARGGKTHGEVSGANGGQQPAAPEGDR
jgi:hypothetical protein